MEDNPENSQKTWSQIVCEPSRYNPSVKDVMSVKGYLFETFNIPIELIDKMIDYAEYWPHTTTCTDTPTIIRAQRDNENKLVVGVPSLHHSM